MLTEEHDIFYHILLESLNNLNVPIGHAGFPIESRQVEEFDPDIIIHNSKTVSKISYKNAITISINEMDEENCFSYRESNSKNYIKPFIKISKSDLNDERYKSDMVYVGNPGLLPDCIGEVQSDPNINFKILNNSPVPISNYCGSCTFDDYKKFFRMAKCSLVDHSESSSSSYSFKLLDILYSGGNPVLHKDDDQFITDIKEALSGKCFRGDFMAKEEIANNHTNYDRMSEIFSKLGLNKMSKMILDSKGK